VAYIDIVPCACSAPGEKRTFDCFMTAQNNHGLRTEYQRIHRPVLLGPSLELKMCINGSVGGPGGRFFGRLPILRRGRQRTAITTRTVTIKAVMTDTICVQHRARNLATGCLVKNQTDAGLSGKVWKRKEVLTHRWQRKRQRHTKSYLCTTGGAEQ
jgi:hypothetical protein